MNKYNPVVARDKILSKGAGFSQFFARDLQDEPHYIIVTTSLFDNIYVYKLVTSGNQITPEQIFIGISHGKICIENPESDSKDSNFRPIYPLKDTSTEEIASLLSELCSGQDINYQTGYLATMSSEATLNWALNNYMDVIRQAKTRYRKDTPIKEKNRTINEIFFLLIQNTSDTEANTKPSGPTSRRLKPILEFVSDYTVLDIETTGLKPDEHDIIELAAMRIRNHEIDCSFQILINPGVEIPVEIEALTGITNSMVADQPSLEEVSDVFLDFIGDDILVGHNLIGFDAEFLNAKIAKAPINHRVIDTLWRARKIFGKSLGNLKLSTIAACLGIQNANAHRALADVETTYRCYERMSLYAKDHGIVVESVRYRDWKASDIKPKHSEKTNQHLDGKIFVLTGGIGCIGRKEAFQRIVDMGGQVKDSVINKTDYLVVGDNGGNITTKHQRALELQKAGSLIQILDADEFLELIEYQTLH